MYRHGQEEIDAATEVLSRDHWFRYVHPEGMTAHADEFEKEWQTAFSTKYAGMTCSGTAALMCCCAGLEIGPGDEVILPGYTWISTASSPLSMGAIPVMVDIDDSMMISPEAIEAAITPRTKAIFPVHLCGLTCDMDQILEIAKKHDLYVVEDSCQCDGGHWNDGRKMGTLGDMGAYSFNQFKVIGCGDSGLYCTDNQQAHERALIFHDAGTTFREHAAELTVPIFSGLNLRGNELLAAIMRVQLNRLDGIISDLHKNHKSICEQVDGAPGISPIRYNGSTGIGTQTGTGATVGLRFETEEAGRKFLANLSAANEDVSGYLPIDSGRHVYVNWECILERRALHTDNMNPYKHEANRDHLPEYSKDMLPKTLDLISRTAMLNINPDWTEGQTNAVADAIKSAAASI